MEEQLIDFGTSRASDPYELIGNAIRISIASGNDKETRRKLAAKTLGEIVENGFLLTLCKEQKQVVERSRANLESELKERVESIEKRERAAAELSHIQADIFKAKRDLNDLQREKEELEEIIKKLRGEEVGGTEEKDQYLSGAKKAYDFIYEKTRDSDRASKAFNSYLLMGKQGEGDPYTTPKSTAGVEYDKEKENRWRKAR